MAGTHAARESNKQVLIFSKEMPTIDVTGRIVSAGAEIPLQEIAERRLNDEARQRIRAWTRKIGNIPLRVNARPCNLSQIKNQARAQHARVGLDFLVVDYVQLVRTGSSSQSQEQEVAEVSKQMKALAMELDIPVVLPAQLNRQSVNRTDPRPTMADLRNSGQLEQDADVVILLYRPPDEHGQSTRGIELLVDKNRHGPTGTVELDWYGAYGVIK
jgi:replicative DNA helicase